MFKGMVLDVDGTLIDNVAAHVACWKEAFMAAGFKLDDGRIHHQVGKGSDQLIPALIGPVDAPLFRQIHDTHHRLYRERWLPKVQPFPDAEALLLELKARHLWVALATSAPSDELDRHLRHLPVQAIDEMVSAQDVQATKPHPDLFNKAFEALRQHDATLIPTQLVIVGDTPYDAEAAQKAGMTSIGLLTGGFSEDELKKAGATAVFSNLSGLMQHLDTVLGA